MLTGPTPEFHAFKCTVQREHSDSGKQKGKDECLNMPTESRLLFHLSHYCQDQLAAVIPGILDLSSTYGHFTLQS